MYTEFIHVACWLLSSERTTEEEKRGRRGGGRGTGSSRSVCKNKVGVGSEVVKYSPLFFFSFFSLFPLSILQSWSLAAEQAHRVTVEVLVGALGHGPPGCLLAGKGHQGFAAALAAQVVQHQDSVGIQLQHTHTHTHTHTHKQKHINKFLNQMCQS